LRLRVVNRFSEQAWQARTRRARADRRSASRRDAHRRQGYDANALREAVAECGASANIPEELDLDHFEGRSRQGLHRHPLMTMIA
jgi:hypothetical protein